MFNLNELITIRQSLSDTIDMLDMDIEKTKRQDLKQMKGHRLAIVIALHKKVQSQVNLSAKFDG